MNTKVANKFRQITGMLVLGLVVVGCGENAVSSSDLPLNSTSTTTVVGVWTLQKFEDQTIDSSDAALLKVSDSGSSASRMAVNRQQDCSGSVNAIVNHEELQLQSDQSNGCFVHFPISVEANRSRISDALRRGSSYELNSDSTLTLQGPAGKLIFVKAQE